jgi:RecA/RadA recombinase
MKLKETSSQKTILNKYSSSILNPEEAGSLERVVLDSPNLNYIFGGGFAKGRIYEFFGPTSGGKSVLSWYIASHIQKQEEQNKVLFLDFEYTFDKNYARAVGLDLSPEKLIFVRALSGEEGFSIAQELVSTGQIGLVIMDSLATITSSRLLASEYGKACVAPSTLVEFKIKNGPFQVAPISKLFEKAGYFYSTMKAFRKEEPQVPIKIKCYDGFLNKVAERKVLGLYY